VTEREYYKRNLEDLVTQRTAELIVSREELDTVEREYIISVLEQTGWKVGGKNSASEILGLDRSTLRARMRKLNIQKP
jgi:transcriptional regulator with GAF, ATPase, and Fis domain